MQESMGQAGSRSRVRGTPRTPAQDVRAGLFCEAGSTAKQVARKVALATPFLPNYLFEDLAMNAAVLNTPWFTLIVWLRKPAQSKAAAAKPAKERVRIAGLR
jgi:hypothetical protein